MSVIINPELFLPGAADPPLTHARILYDNQTGSGVVTATPGVPGRPFQAVLNPFTYESWQPSAMPATLQVLWPDAKPINAIGIASHGLAANATTVTVEVQEDGDAPWEQVASFTPEDDGPILAIFATRYVMGCRLTFSGDVAPRIGVIFTGRTLDMARPIYSGHSPGTLSRTVTITNDRSEGGQALGFAARQRGQATTYEWTNLPPEWYREHYDPFARHTESVGYFFIAWYPLRFPKEVLYGAARSTARPSNTGQPDLMQVSLAVDGLGPISAA